VGVLIAYVYKRLQLIMVMNQVIVSCRRLHKYAISIHD